jgi:hypothetical protein
MSNDQVERLATSRLSHKAHRATSDVLTPDGKPASSTAFSLSVLNVHQLPTDTASRPAQLESSTTPLSDPEISHVSDTWHSIKMKKLLCPISGFRREVDENCVVLGYGAASGGNSVPTYRDNLSVPSSGVKNTKGDPERFLTPEDSV